MTGAGGGALLQEFAASCEPRALPVAMKGGRGQPQQSPTLGPAPCDHVRHDDELLAL